MNKLSSALSLNTLGKRLLADVAFLWIGLPIGVFAGGILYAALGTIGVATETRIAIVITLTIVYISALGVVEVRAAIRSQVIPRGEDPKRILERLATERSKHAQEMLEAKQLVNKLSAENRAVVERIEVLQHAVTEMAKREKVLLDRIEHNPTTFSTLEQTQLPEPNEELTVKLEDLRRRAESIRHQAETDTAELLAREARAKREASIRRGQELRNAGQMKRNR